jgi:hypothetical protein
LDTDGDGILTSNYCNMQIEGWGWTLVMKADWEQTTFEYDSPYWENTTVYNTSEYKYDDQEYKNQQFSILPFKQVMLELKTGTKTRYIIAAVRADSLYDIFNWGTYTPTYLTREVWKTMIEDSSLQTADQQEWFNVTSRSDRARVRFWILWDNESGLPTSNSWIWIWGYYGDNKSVWNYAWEFGPFDFWDCETETCSTSSFWYLYVR